MKNDCHLFKWVFENVAGFVKTDIDIDIPNICLMFGSEQSRGQGKGRVCWREYFKAISPVQPSVLSLAWLAP